MSKNPNPYSFGIKSFVSFILFSLFAFNSSFAQNAIVTENAQAGNPISEWGVGSSADFRNVNLNGYATDISVNKGSTVHFKIDCTNGVAYTIKIYRLGYYGGNGARLKADLGTFTGVKQPAGNFDQTTGLLDCGNWSETASWAVPSTAVSGFYIVKLDDGNGNINNIVFIVRDDASHSNVLFQADDATWQAYNGYGGNNLYNGTTQLNQGHASKVSYNRPFFIYNTGFLTNGLGSDWYMNDAYPMIRWMERNGYDMTYITNVDVARSGTLLKNHKIFVTAGHDEYTSKEQRTAIEAARDAGVNCAFFTGNDMYWKTRWEADANGNANRVLVCYKEGTLADGTTGEATCGFKCDVSSPVWTGMWRMGAAYDAPFPENTLLGQISWTQATAAISVPSTYKSYRFWRNTTVATLGSGQSATMAPSTLGYEMDYEQYASYYPHGRITLSSTAVGSFTHKLSLYKAPSGALVFGAGTVLWSWGLDGSHFGGPNTVSNDMQQATLNLLADMGVQPGSKQSDLDAATASTDVTAPVSVITSPANNSTSPINNAITISGTASDAGGVVAGVEVSTDGGTTWQLASGTTSWTYSFTPTGTGTITIKTRGYDDSGNMEVPVTVGKNVITINIGTAACPCFIFTSQVPSDPLSTETGLELGVKFRSSVAGNITGVRFYKTTGNGGTHIGELYTSTGTKLASATFTGESSSGWQTVTFSSPVSITANTTYIAAYFTPNGTYTGTANYFTTGVTNAPLTGLADGTDGANGVYVYTSTPAFPTNSPGNHPNYWVDVVFNNGGSSAPVANAGSNQTITLPTSSVTLSGSGSTGTITSYAWTKVSGPNTPTITTPTTVSTTVTGLIAGTYVFQLSLNGGASTSQVTITVNAAAAPVANAGSNQTITLPTTTVTLNGSGSTGTISSYAWTKVSGPNTPTITTPTTVSTTVTGLIQGTYVFQLSVNAGASTSQVTITVAAAGTGTNVFTTQIPAVGTDNDNQATVGQEVGLKFKSTSAGTVTGIRFYKTTGNTGTHIGELYNASGTRLAQATFTNETATGWQYVSFSSPVTITANTTYTAAYFSSLGNYTEENDYFLGRSVTNSPLTAAADGTNGGNGTDPGTGQGTYKYTASAAFPNQLYRSANYWVDVIFSTGSTPPVANAGSNQTITLPASTVTINGSGSTGTISAYAWTRVSGPNTPTITTPTTVSTTVTGLIAGTYVFQLSLNAGVSTSQVTITVNPAAVVANAGNTQTITLPVSSVTLNASGSTGTITDYTWTKVSGPNTPVITNPTLVSTTVTGLIAGTYVFQVSVNSSVSTSQVTINVNPAPPLAANAGSNQTITLPVSTVTLNGSGSTGTITDYTWTQVSGPNTSGITNPTTVSTTVTGLIQGSYVFMLSLNSAASTSQVTITVNPAISSSTIFTTQVPVATTDNDFPGATSIQGVEDGTKFTSSIAGYITGIRFYKTAGNAGTHIGELYSSTGVRLAQATFTGETATGWQTVSFSTPVAITANTTYTAAYFSSLGNYTEDNDYFLGHSVVNSPLTAPADGTNGGNGTDPGTGQGTYKYTAAPAFPNQLYRSANYWVDAIFSSSGTGTTAKPATLNTGRAVDELSDSITIYSYSLSQNFPNPVSEQTRIDYSIPISGWVKLALFDMQGKQIKIMVNESKNAGSYFYNLHTSTLAKGIYIYTMQSGSFIATRKLVVQ
jgi:hypothetical protein